MYNIRTNFFLYCIFSLILVQIVVMNEIAIALKIVSAFGVGFLVNCWYTTKNFKSHLRWPNTHRFTIILHETKLLNQHQPINNYSKMLTAKCSCPYHIRHDVIFLNLKFTRKNFESITCFDYFI